ncbi:penicillin amidase [Melghirimyces profundicolus]|uniref:Penicillin amidase n=1 Tax=Melghirimyces profundicolus TaxID=1242148 RepID=A0A2T6C7J7_9BACL|nr:penicillin acylase family protein [Melghirimyces profundicolus]PTX64287.1 penicillin amidase [Melghirimyces profundicolus]
MIKGKNFFSRKRGKPRGICLVLCVVLAAATVLFPGSGPGKGAASAGTADPGGFLNIMPPGQDGTLNTVEWGVYQVTGEYPKHFNDQTKMYDSLSKAARGVTDGELTRYFKEASFGLKGEAERTYSPTEGALIRRDEFGVPHIEGETREATMFAVGYATAEDRLFLMDVLRHLGRGRLSQFLGASEANKAMDRAQVQVAPYKEEELIRQWEASCTQGAEEAEACEDMKAYTAGVNAYIGKALLNPNLLPAEYPALQQMPRKWKPEDSVAIASLVGGIFGKGGGNEVASGRFLSQLRQKHGNKEARAIWEDFRNADDREAPVTTDKPFSYNRHDRVDPRSTALLDLETVDGTLKEMKKPEMAADGPFGKIPLKVPERMSNAILVSGRHTENGRPIAVFGPQTGYFSPQLLVETDVHGPGIDARGVGFAGVNLYVQLGRGRDYAWSATSAGADNVDQWVVKLCEPEGGEPTKESQGYWYKGECKPMDVYTHRQIAKPTAAGIPKPGLENIVFDIEVERTVYGPVNARGTVDGKPVAVTTQRSTYGRELNSALGFKRINDPAFMKDGARSFLKAFDGVEYTFNWFYVDKQDIAYKHSGLAPIRDSRTDPDLPTWGTGEYDWSGEYLKPEQQPHEINPDKGYFVNWNNKQAPGFRANDAEFSYGPAHRSLHLEKRIKEAVNSGEKMTRADMVNIMMDAATVDLKGQETVPWILRVLGEKAPQGDPTLQAMRDRLADWAADGGHRRDVQPRDGQYDHAVAVAIADTALPHWTEAAFGSALEGSDLPFPLEDSPRTGVGSAFIEGVYSHLHKDLRQVLKEPVEDPWHRTYCGDGDLAACREDLWNALSKTSEELAKEYGSERVEDWVYDPSRDAIRQEAVGLVSAPDMAWVNRPTFQQVVQVGVPVQGE